MKRVVGIDGDIWLDANGYERTTKGYVHRLVAEQAVGSPLPVGVIVHHVDRNKSNNNSNNLVVCPDQAYHLLLHARQKIVDYGGHPAMHKYCSYHKAVHNRSEFSTNPSFYDGLNNNCKSATNEYRKERGLNKDKFNWRARLNQQYRRYTKGNITWLLM